MKDCTKCKHLYREGYEDYYYACDFFGDDIPNWASNYQGGCLLREQEIKKALKLNDNCRCSNEEQNARANREYNGYIEILMDRCEDRRNEQDN